MNRTMKLKVLIVVGAIALGQMGQIQAADAKPPELMTYQGYLVDGNGYSLGSEEDPSDSTQRVSSPANYIVVFRVYSAKQGGSAIWAEQQTVTVSNGYFSVLLGQGSQFGSELNGDLSAVFDGADASDRYIGITVDINGVATEIAPRLRLVTSPYAYTARQARRLTDGSGNSNFDKVGTSLELGAGSTPTLTLPEAGGASLVGKLTADLPSWGTGLQIDNGALTTTIGAQDSGLFHFNTGLPQFYFNKNITVDGGIRSYDTDTILGPSNNTDTYLQVYDDTSDKIEARADQFVVQGDSKYLEVKFTSTAAELRSDASKFYINRPLEVEGTLTADSVLANQATITKPDNEEAVLSLLGSTQGTGRLYVGQSTTYGGGIIYNGDGTPAFAGSSVDAISFYRTSNGTHHEVFKYGVNSNDVTFNGSLFLSGSTGLRNVTGNYGSVQTTGGGLGNHEGYSIDGRYVFMSPDNNSYGIYNDINNQWVTNYQNTTGLYKVWLKGTQVLNLAHTNGSRYANYDGDSNWDFYSDRRLKEDIAKEDKLLDRIMSLDVVNYNFIGENKRRHKELGLIAQEVEPLFPSLVSEQDDDRYDFKVKSIGYSSFGVIAVGGIKELKKEKDNEIAELRSENETLKSRMETLTSEMAVLKARLANSTTQEDRIAKLEELVGKIGQGQ
jgi:hypothetical protein